MLKKSLTFLKKKINWKGNCAWWKSQSLSLHLATTGRWAGELIRWKFVRSDHPAGILKVTPIPGGPVVASFSCSLENIIQGSEILGITGGCFQNSKSVIRWQAEVELWACGWLRSCASDLPCSRVCVTSLFFLLWYLLHLLPEVLCDTCVWSQTGIQKTLCPGEGCSWSDAFPVASAS